MAQLTPPANLWERIRRGYGMPNLDNDLVHDREQWYSSRSNYILRMTERSNKYMFHIVEELERRNMPTELALLPLLKAPLTHKRCQPPKLLVCGSSCRPRANI
ncbi:MAG: hypothetical protein IPH54_17855 [Rhodoferax sp.]|nr:hypothetical protein [Rhodoferax sp.]